MENKKLTQEELNELKQLKQQEEMFCFNLGVLELQKREVEEGISNLLNEFKQFKLKSQEFNQTLVKNYGDGNINLEDGTFTPIK